MNYTKKLLIVFLMLPFFSLAQEEAKTEKDTA